MKKIIFLLILTPFFSIFGSNNCEKLALRICEEAALKHYVQADQVVLTELGLMINLENIDLLATSIFHDGGGFYYLEDGVRWICRHCGALNDLDDDKCYRCCEPR